MLVCASNHEICLASSSISNRFGTLPSGALSHKHRHPHVVDIPRSLHEPVDVELPFLNLPGKLDAGNDDGGVVETFKTQHRPHAALNATVVLFDDVVQVGTGAKNRLGREDRFVLEVLDCPV